MSEREDLMAEIEELEDLRDDLAGQLLDVEISLECKECEFEELEVLDDDS